MRKPGCRHRQPTPLSKAMATAFATTLAAACGNAMAVNLPTGNADFSARLDTTVRYNLGVRMEGQDSRILANPTYDESDSKFDKHDIVTNRLDLLEELDLNWKNQFGLRASGAGWYDHAYRDDSVHTVVAGYSPSYENSRYSGRVDRFVHGPSAELLDAFFWANVHLGDVPLNIKLGRHTNYWGEGLLFGAHAISYSQSPTDGVKAVTSPGIETKEVFLPIGQLSMKAQLTDALSLSGQYFYEWDATRLPYGGTYFAPADMLFEGPTLLPVAPNGLAFKRQASATPPDAGNWGLYLKYNAEELESTFGLYYRQFDDYQPWLTPQALASQGAFRLAYPKDVKLIGLSFARVFGAVSFGSEVSVRKDGALNAQGISATDNEGPRGDTLHAVANGVFLLPKTGFSDTGSVAFELAYSQLLKVTEHPELFKGLGYAGCRSLLSSSVAGSGKSSDGCSSRHYLAAAVNFTPQWLQLLPSWDLDLPMSINYGFHGNAASAGGGSEKSLAWSLGVRMTYGQRHEFTLRYADTAAQPTYSANGKALLGGNGSVGTTDRGWLAFTYKTGF